MRGVRFCRTVAGRRAGRVAKADALCSEWQEASPAQGKSWTRIGWPAPTPSSDWLEARPPEEGSAQRLGLLPRRQPLGSAFGLLATYPGALKRHAAHAWQKGISSLSPLTKAYLPYGRIGVTPLLANTSRRMTRMARMAGLRANPARLRRLRG